jgi:hypothetical protein
MTVLPVMVRAEAVAKDVEAFAPGVPDRDLCLGHYPARPHQCLGRVSAAENDEVSRAGESHPRALAEPDVRLSPYPAPIVQPRPCKSAQWANTDGCRRATRAIQCAVCRR